MRSLLISLTIVFSLYPAISQEKEENSGQKDAMEIRRNTQITPDLYLNYHLMHPGRSAGPADPNAAIYSNGQYHLHYIYNPGGERGQFAFAHVMSEDMIHWEWKETNLNKEFTGHGMFSGTAFFTREGNPAVIYHGQGSGYNQIAVAKSRDLTQWERPIPLIPANPEDLDVSRVIHWDPDCFLIGDTYYAIFGNRIGMTEEVPYLVKSKNLEDWEYVGPFMSHEMPDVLTVEDVSCANFFPMGEKWMLLCISHNLGCRYYIGEWNEKEEIFIPEQHHRMSWPFDWHTYDLRHRLNLFAPESILTPDGRRVMWGWLFELPGGVQSLPRDLSLPDDHILRIRPIREMAKLRSEAQSLRNVKLPSGAGQNDPQSHYITNLPGDAVEIRAIIDREKAENANLGFKLFADSPEDEGFPVIIQANSGMLRVGESEAPFAVADLPEGEDLEIRIFIDKYLVEVFVNDRQALPGWSGKWKGKSKLFGYSYLEPSEVKEMTIWKLKAANEGFYKALESKIVE